MSKVEPSRIRVSGPWITHKEIEYVTDAVTHAWYGHANIYHDRFERAFAEYLRVRYAIALPSCTSAIHLSLLALGVGPGDEVVVPDITWIASAAPIVYVGATVVFADIEPHTWCLSASSLKKCVTERTRAIIAVDLYGNVPDWDSIREITKSNSISIIEDAAEAIGSQYHGSLAGSFGTTGVFSFHGSKTLTTGEGGMLVTDREDIYNRVLCLRDHGRNPGDSSFFNREIGYKYKMSSMQAALGLAQLERIDELIQKKRRIFMQYRDLLSGIDGVTLNCEPDDTINTYWMVTALLDSRCGWTKNELISYLSGMDIDSRPFFHPLSSLPPFANSRQASEAKDRNQVSYLLSPYGINLPSGLSLTEEDITAVCCAFKKALARM